MKPRLVIQPLDVTSTVAVVVLGGIAITALLNGAGEVAGSAGGAIGGFLARGVSVRTDPPGRAEAET